MHAARQRREPDAGLGQREDRVRRRDDQVAGQRDLEAAAHRDAVDRRDHGLRHVVARRQPREARGGAGLAARPSPRWPGI